MFELLLYPALVSLFMWGTWRFLAVMPENIWPLVPGLLSMPTLVLMELLERWRPYREEWRKSYGDALTDLAHTLVVFPIVLRLSQLAASVVTMRAFGFGGIPLLPASWPVALQFPAALVIAELCFYSIHRAAHTFPVLWTFHRVHHGSARVYWANAGRFNPFDLWLTMAIYFTPLYLFQLPPQVLVLFLSANVVTGLLEHANIRFNAGILNYVFNSAQLHRWHHDVKIETANHNFGKVLCVWDLAFGTWLLAPERAVGAVGVDDGAPAVPQTLGPQILQPFELLAKRPRAGEVIG